MSSTLEILTQLANFITSDSVTVRLAVTLIILVLGHLLVKLYQKGMNRLLVERREETNRKQLRELKSKIQYTVYVLNASILAAALFYLNAEITRDLFGGIIAALPNVISLILVGVIGFIGVNLITKLATDFFKTVGFGTYVRDAGISRELLKVSELMIKAVLYLLILQFILVQANLAESTIQEFVTAASWALAILIAGLVFYGFKDLFQNLAAGLYLKNSKAVRPGEQVQIDGQSGEIQNVSMFSTEVNTQDGYTLMAQNKEIVKSKFKFKRSKSDIDTLEEMVDYFVADREGFSGPASIEMALDIFGFNARQEEIAEGSEEDEMIDEDLLIDSVEELTDHKIKAAWIEAENTTDLGDEFKTWFNDGALIVPKFDKSEIFPEYEEGEYALSIGVEDTEILMIDPSKQSGGVYYINKDRLTDSMADRGYIVLAPEGTQAYWRIKNNLIYSDKSYYDELSKTLETKLRKTMRQGRILKEAVPEQVERYTEKWRSGEKVSRVWEPEE